MNAPPPFWAATEGNRRKLPSPMALPATAMMMPSRLPHRSCVMAFSRVFVPGLFGKRRRK